MFQTPYGDWTRRDQGPEILTQAKTYHDLGELHGDVLIFGGCYSNAAATNALFDRAAGLGVRPSNLICTGDVCGYCADTQTTIKLVRGSGCAVIAGNVERQLADDADDCGCGFEEGTTCSLLSRDWYGYAQKTVGEEARTWMAGLPDFVSFTHFGKRYAVIHGGTTDISQFLWPCSAPNDFLSEVQALIEIMGSIDGVISGHSGVAFHRQIDGLDWINAGSVGLPPNDGRAATRYAVLGEYGVVFHRLDYDPSTSIVSMQEAGLVQGYDQTLTSGYWPSEDVLPPEMRNKIQDFANG